MTGPGHSPTSPWVQATQGYPHGVRTTNPFHPALSPSNNGPHSTSSLSERPSPNYFGIAVEHSSNPPTSNPGLHTQKNWNALPRAQSSLPSPKLQLYSQESVSEGLVNLLKSESETDKGRRESALRGLASSFEPHPNQSRARGLPSSIVKDGAVSSWPQGQVSGYGFATRKSPTSSAQGKARKFQRLKDSPKSDLLI